MPVYNVKSLESVQVYRYYKVEAPSILEVVRVVTDKEVEPDDQIPSWGTAEIVRIEVEEVKDETSDPE